MIKSWQLEHFKSIKNSGDLAFEPVTVLTGLNSSGKSSLLQSILMISQTLSNRQLDKPLLVKERLVQLGTFADVLTEGLENNERSLSVGFEFENDVEKNKTQEIFSFDEEEKIKSVRLKATFSSANQNEIRNSAIEASKVVVEKVFLQVRLTSSISSKFIQLALPGQEKDNKTDAFADLYLTVERPTDAELQKYIEDVHPEFVRLILGSDTSALYFARLSYKDSGIEHSSYLTLLSHFLPMRFIKKFDIVERYRQDFLDTLANFFTRTSRNTQSTILQRLFNRINNFELEKGEYKKLIDGINQILNEQNIQIQKTFHDDNLKNFITWFANYKHPEKRELGDKLLSKISEIWKSFPFNTSEEKYQFGLETVSPDIYNPESSSDVNALTLIENAIDEITKFFTANIRYLGPLRTSEPFQGFAPSSEFDDVGAKGEYAATVYETNQNARIEWYEPTKEKILKGTLKEALNFWTVYLGIAQEIQIETAGRIGVSWRVIPNKNRNPRLLSEVGVGVSQVLPILVMGLLAPKNSLLLIEQPELHLHPAIQSRLADFFVGLSKCKKQCVIETHSENLVNQIRYHIVRSGGIENSNCGIYFVHQDELDAARFDLVQISNKGNILNWPPGFFDESLLQKDKITTASLEARRNLNANR